MFITFLGNPRDGKDNRGSVTIGGVTFPLNRLVEVADSALFAKLRGNQHFQVDDASPEVSDPIVDPKADLIAFAEAHEIKIDRRWSVDKIKAVIEAAKDED